jgi:hypothetical protein
MFAIILSGCQHTDKNVSNKQNNTNAIENKQNSVENNDIIYINDELGFSLTFPHNWKNYYKISEFEDGITINFYGKSHAGRGTTTDREDGLIMFFILNDDLVKTQTLDSVTKLGTSSGINYYFATGTGFDLEPIALTDEETAKQFLDVYGPKIYGEAQLPLILEDWKKAQQMQEDIPTILDSFKEFK